MEEAMEFNEAQFTESKMVIVDRDSEIGRFQNQVQTLEELLEEKIAKIKDLEVVKISLVIELAEIREDKKVVDQRMLLVQQERIDERDVLIKFGKEKESDIKSLEDRLVERIDSEVVLNLQISGLETKLSDAATRVSELGDELSHLKEKLAQKDDSLSSKRAELEATLVELKGLSSSNEHLEKKLMENNKDMTEIRAHNQELETNTMRLTNRLNELKDGLGHKEEMLLNLQSSIKETETTLSRERMQFQMQLESKAADVQVEKDNSQRLLEIVNSTKAELLKEREEGKLKVENLLSELKGRTSELNDELQHLQYQLWSAKDEHEEFVLQTDQKLTIMDMENQRLQSLAAELSGVVDQKTMDLGEIQSDNYSLKQQTELYVEEKEELQSLINHLESKNKNDMESLKAQIKESNTYIDKLQSSLEIKRNELTAAISDNQKLVDDIKLIRTNSKAEFNTLKQQIGDLQHSKAEAHQFESLINNLKEQLTEKEHEFSILWKGKDDETQKLARDRQTLETQLTQANLKISDLLSKSHDLQCQFDDTNRAYNAMIDDIKMLKTEKPPEELPAIKNPNQDFQLGR